MIAKLSLYLTYPFVQYALVVGVLISLASSLLGVSLVLKRFSFLGDGLSHVAFGAMAVAAVLQLSNNLFFVLPITVACAILLLKGGKTKLLNGDAAIALLATSSLAFGYLLMNVFSTGANISGDVCTTLFGSVSILTLTKEEVILSVVLSILAIAYFILYYNRIFALSFDENFAKASGSHTGAMNLMNAVVIAVIIVLAMNLVGSLLVSALIVFPTVTAMRVVKSFRSVCIMAGILAVLSVILGILVSILCSTPVGSTIVSVDALFFALFALIGHVK